MPDQPDPPPPPGHPAPGGDVAPPPGWQEPSPAPPGPWGPRGAVARGPAPGMVGAAHKPGAVPLRPLGLGDMYDAAFRIIRYNPKATVGSAVLVAVVSMVLPVAVTLALTFTTGLTYDPADPDPSEGDLVGLVAAYGSLGLGAVAQSFGLLLVTGMVARVTAAAAVGRRMSLGEAWAETRGRRWRLVGLSLLLGLTLLIGTGAYVVLWAVVVTVGDVATIVVFAVLSVPAFLALLVWFWVRVYYLPVPPLMLEEVGVLGAVGRGFRLTRSAFWRTFGIALLTVLATNIAAGILSTPFSLGANFGALAVDPSYALLVIVIGSALAQVVGSAFVAPFSAAVTTLQYLDQRMRKEAYDVDLMAQAGILRS